MRYRPHRGSLSASMKEETVYNNIEEMKEAIACEYYDKEDIVLKAIRRPSDDPTQPPSLTMVGVKRFGDEDYIKLYGCPQCIGYVEVKECLK